MFVNAPQSNNVIDNLGFFCDLELDLGLDAILPLLTYVHTFIKLSQFWDVFLCDYIDIVKIF
jgi:hypothetical protein